MHFISGLPRAGSTLLAAILRQNPHCHADMSSPLAGIYNGLLERMTGKNEYHLAISDAQRRAICEGLFTSFYAHVPEEKVVFDTNRVWCGKIADLSLLFPDARIVCCVRSVAWVLDSFEKLAQANPLYCSRTFNFDPTGTVYSHVDALMNGSGSVGAAYNALKGAFFGPLSSRLIVIDYESLARDPVRAMRSLYDALGVAFFEHDFSAVSFSSPEFDRSAGCPGLHTVSGPVRYVERETLLPPDLFDKFAGSSFWKKAHNGRRPVRVI